MKKYICSFLFALTLFSCGDFLEPQSQSEFEPKDISALDELLLGEAIPGLINKYYVLTGLVSALDDDVTCHSYVAPLPSALEPHYSNNSFLALQALYSWQPNYSELMQARSQASFDSYSDHYKFIMGCNAVLDNIDEVGGTVNEKKYVRAQALTLRGYYYFQLVNIYGAPYNKDKKALGVPLKLISSLENRPFTRNTVEEVYTQVEKDLLEAEKLFGEVSEKRQWTKNYRPSMPMAQLLLSRMYLYMENWEKAAEYSDKVINDWSFELLDLRTLVVPANQYYNFITYDSPESIWVFGSADTDLTKYTQTLLSVNSGNSYLNPTALMASDELLNNFETGDMRKNRYIVAEPSDATKYRAYGKVAITSKGTGYRVQSSGAYWGQALRLSEAYLNYAEANAMLFKNGNTSAKTKAVNTLNSLRVKRFENASYTPVPDMNADDLVTFVRNERRRELCFEAHRWFDLRRYGMTEIKHTWINEDPLTSSPLVYTLVENDNGYTLPIPHTVMNLNSNLIQNPLAPERIPTH